MGWWSKDIMGGDTPLDIQDNICDLVGVHSFTETDKNAKEAVWLSENWKEVIKHFQYQEFWKGWFEDEGYLVYQIIGYLLIRVGAPVDDELKQLLIKACEQDDWAKEDDDRKEVIDNFKQVIENYKGEAVPLTSSGLFEVIAKHMSSNG